MENTAQTTPPDSSKWVSLPERFGFCLVSVEGRRILVLVQISETGLVQLRVAGFYLEQSQLIGDSHGRLTFRVEEIPEGTRESLEPKIRAELPTDLTNLPLSY